MIVTCPSCATRYLVDPAALGQDGRTVRCAKCSNTWHQVPIVEAPPEPRLFAEPEPEFNPYRDEDEAVTPPSMIGGGYSEPPDDPMPSFISSGRSRSGNAQLPALHEPRKRFNLVLIGWIALALLVGMLGGGGYWFRADIVAFWPPSARLFNALGDNFEKAETQGLKFGKLDSANTNVDGKNVLVLAGEITNITAQTRALPMLRVSLVDAQGKILVQSDFPAGRPQLLPGETMPFRTSVTAPPAGAVKASVTFAVD